MPTGLPPLSPLFPKVTPKSCLKGFPACHRNHSGTHSIDVVSNCSCGQWFRLSCLTMELCIHQEKSHMSPCHKGTLWTETNHIPYTQNHFHLGISTPQHNTHSHIIYIYIHYITLYTHLNTWLYKLDILQASVCPNAKKNGISHDIPTFSLPFLSSKWPLRNVAIRPCPRPWHSCSPSPPAQRKGCWWITLKRKK